MVESNQPVLSLAFQTNILTVKSQNKKIFWAPSGFEKTEESVMLSDATRWRAW